MRMLRTSGAAAVAIAVGVAGCGGGGGDLGSPKATVKTYLTGVGNGDGQAACSALTPALQTSAVRTATAQGLKASSCANLFAQVKSHLTADQRKRFLNAKVSKVTQSGNTATVTVAGATNTPTVTKSGGKWLISGGVGF